MLLGLHAVVPVERLDAVVVAALVDVLVPVRASLEVRPGRVATPYSPMITGMPWSTHFAFTCAKSDVEVALLGPGAWLTESGNGAPQYRQAPFGFSVKSYGS